MKKLLALLFFFSWAFAEDPLIVSVTLPPYAKILEEIGGDRVEALSLVPSNADPHTFEPKPAILKQFSKVKIYLSDGSNMDAAWKPRFLGVNPKVKSVDISKGISWIEEEDHHHGNESEHSEQEAAELDPHLWTSPRVLLVLSQNILDALIQEDPAGKTYYEERFKKFDETIKKLDAYFKKIASELPENRRTFVVFHPSYGYLARDYGLEQMAIETEGKEPKPQDMKKLVQKAREHQVKVIFVQPQFNKRAAETLAKELGAKIIVNNALAYDFDKSLREFGEALLQSVQNK
ncbi:MAG: zinc ABC transporter substrate-binding protein [Fibrobacter sp.]|jgi:zinc transport system substrate-binding protein|nr:zinc ABC transporter substrate-binding protein [Fibrobacter sp.]